MARTPSIEAREKVLAATQALVLDEGLEGFTIDAVAHRSGVAKTTIYRHFGDAHHLVVEALDCMVTLLPTPNTGSLRADLLEFFDQRLMLATDAGLRQMLLGLLHASAHDPELRRVFDAMQDQRITPIRTMVELARARGEVRPDVEVDHVVDLIQGPLFMRAMVRHLPTTSADVEALIDLAVTAVAPVPAPT